MEYLIDTANLSEIKEAIDFYPIKGITTNPTILKNEGPKNIKEHLKSIYSLCTSHSFHVQLSSDTSTAMLEEAEKYLQLLGKDVYLKIPATKEGIKAIQQLKKQGKNITATAIYYQFQGLLAVEAGADYIAPYCNRMENNDISFQTTIEGFRKIIDRDHYASKILAASFKNITQINQAILSGAHGVTIQPSIIQAALNTPLVIDAVNTFKADYNAIVKNNDFALR